MAAQHHDPDGLTDPFPRLDRHTQILPLPSGFDGDARVAAYSTTTLRASSSKTPGAQA